MSLTTIYTNMKSGGLNGKKARKGVDSHLSPTPFINHFLLSNIDLRSANGLNVALSLLPSSLAVLP